MTCEVPMVNSDGPWICENCDDFSPQERNTCTSCEWPRERPVDRTKPLCSICRRRHGRERQHASE